MAQGDLQPLWRRVRSIEDSLGDAVDRLDRIEVDAKDMARAMTELVRELKPVMTDYAYARRRREDRRRTMGDWRIWLAFLGGLVIVGQAAVDIVLRFHG